MSDPTTRRSLPGEPAGRQLIERVLRVDHAGEYGAKRIYEGQLAVLGDMPVGTSIREMAENEAEHLAWFERKMREEGVRPTALQPFWHVAGYALGAATALMGPRAAMACTVAVEEAIDAHYRHQEAALGAQDRTLKSAIERFHAEELEHRDTALAQGAEQAPGYRVLTSAIKAGCRAAIWLAERV
jgi:ubiquinone biosynthesis monooxygenase Coq7